MRQTVIWLALVVAGLAYQTPAIQAEPLPFSVKERELIVSHGPWPQPVSADPGNRMSGIPDAVAFGRAMFDNPALSADRNRSCASCHNPELGYAERRPRAIGLSLVDRNTISLFNVRLNRWFGWAGQTDSLWAQSIRALLSPQEHALTPDLVRKRVVADRFLSRGYRRVFGTDARSHTREAVLVNIAKCLAAFLETINSGRSSFDKFRDAIASGDDDAIGNYPEAAMRGLKIFIGKGQCRICHYGPNFTNGEFHNIGLLHFVEPGRVDPGRYSGIKELRLSRFSLMGRYNDDTTRRNAFLTMRVRLLPRNWGEFRVPSLRNSPKTAPYMHDGSKPTLFDAVRHYSEVDEERLHQGRQGLLRPLRLTEHEIKDVVSFLKTL